MNDQLPKLFPLLKVVLNQDSAVNVAIAAL